MVLKNSNQKKLQLSTEVIRCQTKNRLSTEVSRYQTKNRLSTEVTRCQKTSPVGACTLPLADFFRKNETFWKQKSDFLVNFGNVWVSF